MGTPTHASRAYAVPRTGQHDGAGGQHRQGDQPQHSHRLTGLSAGVVAEVERVGASTVRVGAGDEPDDGEEHDQSGAAAEQGREERQHPGPGPGAARSAR